MCKPAFLEDPRAILQYKGLDGLVLGAANNAGKIRFRGTLKRNLPGDDILIVTL